MILCAPVLLPKPPNLGLIRTSENLLLHKIENFVYYLVDLLVDGNSRLLAVHKAFKIANTNKLWLLCFLPWIVSISLTPARWWTWNWAALNSVSESAYTLTPMHGTTVDQKYIAKEVAPSTSSGRFLVEALWYSITFIHLSESIMTSAFLDHAES